MVRRTGLTYRQLDYWTRLGYLVADENRPGSGNVRTFHPGEVAVGTIMRRLVTAGLIVEAAAFIARDIADGADTVSLGPGLVVTISEEAP